MSPEQAERVFGALSDGTRRSILQMVAEEGPLTATQVATRFPITRQAASKHLASLQQAEMVSASRAGREVRFELAGEGLAAGAEWLSAVGEQWDRRLARLREHVRQ